ncbi:MAG: pyridoxamine 5'-phosphate oxidase family protein [Acidipila sp.]|nr:pyridoxamine 5'-phosphate oxidase family protein [Acidipila sp.]
MENFTPTPRTQVKRLPDRGLYDRAEVYKILEQGFLCHSGFMVEDQPFVIPTGYGRVDDQLYIHGSAASRMLRSLSGGIKMCLTVTLLDGLVLARSAFHHSMNYRSVVILGTATLVEDAAEKTKALLAISEQIIRGRWAEVRSPTEKELKATIVLRVPLLEVSAKVRTGMPHDDEEDYQLPIWAGVLPISQVPAAPLADPRNLPNLSVPESVRKYSR